MYFRFSLSLTMTPCNCLQNQFSLPGTPVLYELLLKRLRYNFQFITKLKKVRFHTGAPGDEGIQKLRVDICCKTACGLFWVNALI